MVFVPALVSLTVTVNVILFPIATVAGPGTLVLVLRLLTVSADVPELPACELSPEYVAVTVAALGVAGAAYVVLHELELELALTNTQVELLKLPPAPASYHETILVGVDGAALASVTVTL